MRFKLVACMIFLWLSSQNIFSEAFGNSALSLPSAGMVFFDDLNFSTNKTWGIDRQYVLGTSFMQAFSYKWWWLAESSWAFGHSNIASSQFVSSIFAKAGVRRDLVDGDFRPYVALLMSYLQFVGEGKNYILHEHPWPIWVGPEISLGIEWFFYSEMSLKAAGFFDVLFNIHEKPRYAIAWSSSFVFYF